MNICVPKERRPFEYRVGLTPSRLKMLTKNGHQCYVEHEAGLGAGFSDQEYQQAGAIIAYSSHEVFGRADLLLKVARPLLEEIDWLQPGATIAGLIHFGSARQDKIDKLLQKKITTIAYEQIQLPDGTVPVRRPLSEIGGRLAAQIAARLLQNDAGGKGILIGGVPAVPPAEVVIIGGGVVGTFATHAFLGMDAHVTVLDKNLRALQRISERFSCVTLISNPSNIARACAYADVIIGAVLVTGEPPPIVVTRSILHNMKERSVVMDVSIDEGGCIETSRPTTHEHPTFIEEGLIHYCVPNMPSIVARTATHAFLNAAFPFIFEIANKGIEKAISGNPSLKLGVGTYQGEIKNISTLSPRQQME